MPCSRSPADRAGDLDDGHRLPASAAGAPARSGRASSSTLPATATLLGPPAYDRGSGCSGTLKVDRNIDYLPNGGTTSVRFSIRVGGSSQQHVVASANADRDANMADNSATLTLRVRAPGPAGGGGTPPTNTPTSITGTAGANTLEGTIRNDVIRGLGGNDRLFGRSGNDT